MISSFVEMAAFERTLGEEASHLFKAGVNNDPGFLARCRELEAAQAVLDAKWNAIYLLQPLVLTRYGQVQKGEEQTFKLLDEQSGDHFGPVLPLPALKDWALANADAIAARFAA